MRNYTYRSNQYSARKTDKTLLLNMARRGANKAWQTLRREIDDVISRNITYMKLLGINDLLELMKQADANPEFIDSIQGISDRYVRHMSAAGTELRFLMNELDNFMLEIEKARAKQ